MNIAQRRLSTEKDDDSNQEILVRDFRVVMLGNLLVGGWRHVNGWALGHATGTCH